jgi:hypothetical protein
MNLDRPEIAALSERFHIRAKALSRKARASSSSVDIPVDGNGGSIAMGRARAGSCSDSFGEHRALAMCREGPILTVRRVAVSKAFGCALLVVRKARGLSQEALAAMDLGWFPPSLENSRGHGTRKRHC